MIKPLPSAWVDSLFARLIIFYGRPFMAQYEGLDEELVKAEWASKLGGFQRQREERTEVPAVAWALDNLPTKPPSLPEFRDVCRSYREPDQLALPAPPREVPERFRNAIAQLGMPMGDERPEKVRVAARYIAMWGTTGVKLNPLKQEILREMRAIVGDYEAQEQARKQREAREAQEQSA